MYRDGKFVLVHAPTFASLNEVRRNGETFDALLNRLIGKKKENAHVESMSEESSRSGQEENYHKKH